MAFFESYRALFAEDMPRMKRGAAVIVSAVAAVLTVASGVILPNPTALLTLSLSVALLASLLFTHRSPLISLIPVCASVCVLFVTDSLPASIFSLASLPAAAVLAVVFYKKSSRASAVASVSVFFGVSFVVAVGTLYLTAPDALPDIPSIKTALTDAIASVTVNTSAGRVPLYTEDAAAGLASYLVLSLPAFAVIAVNTVSFVSVSVFALLVRLFGFSDSIPNGRWTYMPELAAAVIYLLSYAVSASLIPFPSADVIGFAAENVLISLIPAMMIAGERALWLFSKKHDGLIVFAILSAVVFIVSPSLYLMIISFAGAFYVIIDRVRPYLRRFMSRGDGE